MVDDMLNPIETFFASHGWTAFPFQIEAWQAYLNGESGLIHAATGTGKTYAAWMGVLAEWLAQHPESHDEGSLRAQHAAPLQALWITPLRALAADTEGALREAIEGMGVNWTIETRTGDTSSAARNRQRKRLPSALVTTPESLSLLLARADSEEMFKHLRLVVVDEWHELMASKRGVQTELGLARLRAWHPDLRTWGLSATMGNLPVALQAMLGVANIETGEVPQGRLIQGQEPKAVHIESIIPPQIERFPWAGHLGLNLVPDVVRVIEQGRTALVFTNTRSQTEVWYMALMDAKPEWIGEIALHHSSLDRNTREWVEDALREGRVRCVVCTSSLDLGVDFAPVDAVLQIGSPKGAARLLQRTGRSGHRPGAESRVTCVPTHAFELIEVAAARDAIAAGHIEARPPIERPLDVLAQHMVTIGLGGGFESEQLYREVRTSLAYRDLSRAEWDWTLDFVTRGGEALRAYPEYSRVELVDGRYIVTNKTVGQMHRMSIGTITTDASLKVQYLRGAEIGYVDESFLARLKPGDKFTLGGKVLEFVRIRDMKAFVRRAKSNKGVIPRWLGGGFPLTSELTDAVRDKLEEARQGVFNSVEMEAVRPILELQAKVSQIPARGELLIERTKTRDGHHLFVYPFEGRLVNEGLAALCAYRMAQLQPITFTLAVNDYGFEMLSSERAPLETALANGLFDPESLAEDIFSSLNASELAKRQFREIARVAGLVFQRFPGGQKTSKQLQASSSLIYDVFMKYDPGNLLLAQASREVLERQLEVNRLQHSLDKIAAGPVQIVETRRPSPFAFPLLVERLRETTVTSEKLADRVKRMQLALERE